MIRIFFALILLIHGLIHLLGFAKGFKYAEVSQLTQPISRPAGALWGFSALLFAAATVLFLLRKDVWWMLALPAVILSQGLVFSSWQDARFGTIANLIALAGILPACGNWNFSNMVRRELSTFIPQIIPPNQIVTRDMCAPPPPVIQRWLERSGVIGQPLTYSVHLKQRGRMKTSPEGQWIPFEAEQWNTTDPPGFIWTTQIQAAPGVTLVGRDKYVGGHGHMLIKMWSLFPVADAQGPETDQGSMLRNLAEICWFPSAALRPYIQWEPIDSLSARATMQYGGISASGIFHFNAEGDMTLFEAKRYYTRKEGATLEDWLVENKNYRTMEGIRIPSESEITWKLPTGAFTWLNLEIVEVERL